MEIRCNSPLPSDVQTYTVSADKANLVFVGNASLLSSQFHTRQSSLLICISMLQMLRVLAAIRISFESQIYSMHAFRSRFCSRNLPLVERVENNLNPLLNDTLLHCWLLCNLCILIYYLCLYKSISFSIIPTVMVGERN